MLTCLTSGESHGSCLTAVVDGLPAGMRVDSERIDYHLARRQKGYGRGGRQRIEKDKARIVSGVRHGLSLGGPITLVIENRDWVNWAEIMDPLKAPSESLPPKQRKLLEDSSRPRPATPIWRAASSITITICATCWNALRRVRLPPGWPPVRSCASFSNISACA